MTSRLKKASGFSPGTVVKICYRALQGTSVVIQSGVGMNQLFSLVNVRGPIFALVKTSKLRRLEIPKPAYLIGDTIRAGRIKTSVECVEWNGSSWKYEARVGKPIREISFPTWKIVNSPSRTWSLPRFSYGEVCFTKELDELREHKMKWCYLPLLKNSPDPWSYTTLGNAGIGEEDEIFSPEYAAAMQLAL